MARTRVPAPTWPRSSTAAEQPASAPSIESLIDVHCHVIPGIDDGPADDSESAALLEALAADGVDMVAATPHFRGDHPAVTPEVVAAESTRMGALADTPQVIAGGEVGIDWLTRASEPDLLRATYGQLGKDILLETPAGPLPSQFYDAVFRLKAHGLRIVLAHPERSITFQEQPGKLGELVADGVLVQVNASSLLTTARGSRARSLAFALLDEGAAHLIASDAHSAGWRPPLLSAAVERAEARIGARARWMVTAAPAAVVAGAPLPPAPRTGGGRGGFLKRRRRG